MQFIRFLLVCMSKQKERLIWPLNPTGRDLSCLFVSSIISWLYMLNRVRDWIFMCWIWPNFVWPKLMWIKRGQAIDWGDGKDKQGRPPHKHAQTHTNTRAPCGAIREGRICLPPFHVLLSSHLSEPSRHPACGAARPNTLIRGSISCESCQPHTEILIQCTYLCSSVSGNPAASSFLSILYILTR